MSLKSLILPFIHETSFMTILCCCHLFEAFFKVLVILWSWMPWPLFSRLSQACCTISLALKFIVYNRHKIKIQPLKIMGNRSLLLRRRSLLNLGRTNRQRQRHGAHVCNFVIFPKHFSITVQSSWMVAALPSPSPPPQLLLAYKSKSAQYNFS